MTPTDLRAWQAHMGYTQQRAAEALGVSLATYKRYLTGEVPHVVGLACAAIAHSIKPWKSQRQNRDL